MIIILAARAADYLGQKPWVGSSISVTGFITGTFISHLIMIFQLLALTVSIVVGVLTIIGWFQKRKNKQ